ncbi:MAG: EamA family transporter [Clostridia bacterium]|nr:EamA family transporter [Clostridia bacterium]
MALYYLMTLASVLMETAKNVFSNSFSKNYLKNNTDVYKFNTFMYAGSLAVMVVMLFVEGCKLSLYTVGMAFLFALVSGGMQTALLRALRHGPLSFVNFIQTSGGLVIPALFGALFLKQGIKLLQVIALPILILSMALVMDLRGEKKTRDQKGGRWLPDAILSMVCCGLVGVLQTLHQESDHSDELYSFLAVTFFFIVLMNLVPWLMGEKKEPANFSMRTRAFVQPVGSGVFMGIVNVVNLFLIGVMPSVIFFPIANGGLLTMTILAAVVFFRERLKPVQWVGIVIGIAAMCLLCI